MTTDQRPRFDVKWLREHADGYEHTLDSYTPRLLRDAADEIDRLCAYIVNWLGEEALRAFDEGKR